MSKVYEELEKYAKISDNVKLVMDIIGYAESRGYFLKFSANCNSVQKSTFEDLLMEYFDIDKVKLDRERQELLQDYINGNN